MSNAMSRRSFVTATAGVAAAGLAAAGLSAEPAQAKVIAESSSVWDLEEVGEPT